MTLMPALFIGHGSPMNTLEENGFTRSWRALGRALPRPRAILAVSAHWYFGATAITAMPPRARSTISTASRPSCSSSNIRPWATPTSPVRSSNW